MIIRPVYRFWIEWKEIAEIRIREGIA